MGHSPLVGRWVAEATVRATGRPRAFALCPASVLISGAGAVFPVLRDLGLAPLLRLGNWISTP